MNSVCIVTLGCKQNKYESDCMARILIDKGYVVSEKLQKADIYILNTCAVTSEAEKKSRQYIAKFNALNPECKIIVCGCASQNNLEQFIGKENVYSIFGTQDKENILEYISNNINALKPITSEYVSPVCPIKSTTREYLKIQDGCNNFCTYCIIPYLRGRTRSRDFIEVINEAKLLATRSREIVITGIDISSYMVDGKPALAGLMQELANLDAMIRLGSLEVGVITEELLQVLVDMPNFAPHFHLSLQSGDDEILKKMNRHYTTDEFYSKVELIRKYFPNVNLTTDIIVGFAGETEEQFENTRKFIEKVGFSFVHIFPYSKRAGTIAYKFPDLPMQIKKERVDKLELVNESLKKKYLSKFIGETSTMLAEEEKNGLYEGFSPSYIRCYSKSKLVSGDVYKIKFIEIYKDGMLVDLIGG